MLRYQSRAVDEAQLQVLSLCEVIFLEEMEAMYRGLCTRRLICEVQLIQSNCDSRVAPQTLEGTDFHRSVRTVNGQWFGNSLPAVH